MHNSEEGVVQIVHVLLLLEQKQHLWTWTKKKFQIFIQKYLIEFHVEILSNN
jgi:hypothetical protein